jgi:hypothetical protein
VDLEQRLDSEPVLKFAMHCLDWGAGIIPAPVDHVEFLGSGKVQHDLTVMFDALRPGLTDRTAVSPPGTLYRQSFVALFNHLEQTLALWRRGFLLKEDLPRTRWVANELLNWTYAPLSGQSTAEWFRPAMGAWYKNTSNGKTLEDLVVAFVALRREARA